MLRDSFMVKKRPSLFSSSLTLALALTLGLAAKTSAQQFGPFSYELDDGEVLLTGYNGPAGSVALPASIEGNPVTGSGSACSRTRPA